MSSVLKQDSLSFKTGTLWEADCGPWKLIWLFLKVSWAAREELSVTFLAACHLPVSLIQTPTGSVVPKAGKPSSFCLAHCLSGLCTGSHIVGQQKENKATIKGALCDGLKGFRNVWAMQFSSTDTANDFLTENEKMCLVRAQPEFCLFFQSLPFVSSLLSG